MSVDGNVLIYFSSVLVLAVINFIHNADFVATLYKIWTANRTRTSSISTAFDWERSGSLPEMGLHDYDDDVVEMVILVL